MAEVITHAEWKAGKKKNGVHPPKNKQDVGPTLDQFHKALKYKDKVAFLNKIIAGLKVIRDANKDNPGTAVTFVDKTVKECKAALFDIKKNGLEADGMEDTKKEVIKKCHALTWDVVWKDAKLKKLLGKYAKATHTDDNFNFLDAVDKGNGVEIYNTYIKKGSPSEINIDSTIFSDLNNQFRTNPLGRLNYDKAYKHIWAAFSRDTFKRFREQPPIELQVAIAENEGIL
jgi:hypothetical protein